MWLLQNKRAPAQFERRMCSAAQRLSAVVLLFTHSTLSGDKPNPAKPRETLINSADPVPAGAAT
jgi:hypothetical protein